MANPISKLSLLPTAALAAAEFGTIPQASFDKWPDVDEADYPATDFDSWADEFLGDRYATDEQYGRLAEVYDLRDAALNADVRGFLGFAAMMARVQKLADQLEIVDDLVAEYRPYLEDPEIRAFIDRWYGLSRTSDGEIDLTFLEMHKIGTTSFILRCFTEPLQKSEREEELALKCLIPRYVNIRPIATATAAYRARMTRIRRAGATNVPHVRAYKASRFIGMDFIRGQTLDERSRLLLASVPNAHRIEALLASPEALTFLRLIVERLTEALASLARYDQRHLDLSPYNVIIGDDGLIYLIDFGRNYLVEEVLRAGPVYERIIMYVAPELVADATTDEYTCDLYSLGIVLLDVLTGGGSTRDRVNGRLMRLWRIAPGLATVIEELIATDPARRVRAAGDESPVEAYAVIRTRLLEELEIAAASVQRIEAETHEWMWRGGFATVALADYLMVRPPEIGALFAAAKELSKEKEEASIDSSNKESSSSGHVSDRVRYFRRLGWWSRAYVFAWSLLFAPAVGLTIADSVVHGGEKPTEGLLGFIATHTHMQIGQPQHNIPGRAIAITTALIAVGYYVNIFSMLDFRSLRRSSHLVCKVAPVATRLLPLVAVCGQGVAVFYDPRLWGYTAGIGGLLVSGGNWVWRRVLAIGRVQLGANDRLASELSEFEDSFRNWWWLMGLYSLGVLVVGALVRAGVAHDEVIYAVVIAGGINILKIYVNNATRDAGRVRSHLARAVLGAGG